MKTKIILYLSLFIFLYSCQSLKDGLTGKKKNNSDEFLVEKKNPLEMPPDFDELPVPNIKKDLDKNENTEKEIENLIKSVSNTEKIDSNNKSAEEFIIKEINRN
tara:strand:- start:616 stop:927 length:312 start_codon:yes stop_codon:yes gene_type:complete